MAGEREAKPGDHDITEELQRACVASSSKSYWWHQKDEKWRVSRRSSKEEVTGDLNVNRSSVTVGVEG